MGGQPATVWAQGNLQLLSPPELLEILHRKGFSGRLVLISAATPRRVVAIHMDGGRPALVIGGDPAQPTDAGNEAYNARQALVRALGWSVGAFRVEAMDPPLPAGATRQQLGDVANLVLAARERSRLWPRLLQRLPGTFSETRVAPASVQLRPEDPTQQAVLRALDHPMTLAELARRARLDDHQLLQAVLDLADADMLRLGAGADTAISDDPALVPLLSELLGSLTGEDGHTLKITILSWDARTCFQTVEALLGRFRPPPEDVERQPRFHILHENAPLPDGYKLEVLAFRADTFEPTFAAPLVQGSHIFLIVTDVEAGHVWGAERPLADRLNELRDMFHGAMVAGRVTVGASAVTDPGSDVIIPEIARYVGWSEVSSRRFLPTVLREVARRLGLDVEPQSSPASGS